MERDSWSNCERVAIDDLAAVECLRSLAGLVRTGLPLRAALLAWPAEASGDAQQALVQVARRLSLGEGVGPALATLDSVWDPRASSALRTVLIVHLRVGGDVALMIDAVAEGLARRAESLEAARAAAAGMRLSGRMVAALPMVFLPLTGVTHLPDRLHRVVFAGDGITAVRLRPGVDGSVGAHRTGQGWDRMARRHRRRRAARRDRATPNTRGGRRAGSRGYRLGP